jgi:hypothetical protein
VAKVAGEVVGEKLLGGVELVVGRWGRGTTGGGYRQWGCLQRKMMAGELLLPGFAS